MPSTLQMTLIAMPHIILSVALQKAETSLMMVHAITSISVLLHMGFSECDLSYLFFYPDHSLKAKCEVFYDAIYHTSAYSNWNPKNNIYKRVPEKVFCCRISSENLWHNVSENNSVWRPGWWTVFMVLLKPAVISSKLSSKGTGHARCWRVIRLYSWS